MKKILGLILSVSMLIVFSACSDEKTNDEKKEEVKDPKVAMEEAYKDFLDNLEDSDYYFFYEEGDNNMEGEFYTNGTFKYSVASEGIEMTLVCGVDDKYSFDMGEYSEDFTEDDIKELCSEDDESLEYKEFLEDFDEDLFDDADEDEANFEEKDDYYLATPKDEDEEIEEFRIYKDGQKIEVIAQDGTFIIETL